MGINLSNVNKLTGDGQGVDGDAVVLVLLVGVGAPQPEGGQQGAEDVGHDADHHEGGGSTDVT